MKKQMYVIVLVLCVSLGILLAGCAGQGGATTSGAEVAAPAAKAPGAESGKAAPAGNPQAVDPNNPAQGKDQPGAQPGQAAPDGGNPNPEAAKPVLTASDLSAQGTPPAPGGNNPAPQGAPPASTGGEPGSQGGVRPGMSMTGSLPLSMQLAVGTIALETTDYAVTADQAAVLLPLWQAATALITDSNVTTDTWNAAIESIQVAMTTEQLEAIAAMDLTGEKVTELAQQYGIQLPTGGPMGTLTPEMQATMEAARASGQMPQGGPGGGGPGGAPGGGPGGGAPGGQSGGPGGQAGGAGAPGGAPGGSGGAMGGQRRGGGMEALIYQAVIDLLTAKIQ